MKLLQYVLLPFSLIYALVMAVRNIFYDKGWFYSASFDRPLISVGNLTVGGTGKTPMVEYLVRLLKRDFKIATLSRGYGRRTKGYRMASADESALTVGDEPYQYFLKFGPEVSVHVGEERALAIPEILSRKEDTELIILDDAYQHRKVSPDFNILLTDYNRPFYYDFVLPAGRLRESRSGAKRADIVIVTKCPPDLDAEKRKEIKEKIKPYTKGETPVAFTTISYEKPKAVPGTTSEKMGEQVLLVSGIANPRPLENYVAREFQLVKHMVFRDHYVYTPADLTAIRKAFEAIEQNNKAILLTEKDMARLLNDELKPLIAGLPIFYLPIAIRFLEGEQALGQLLFQKTGLKKQSER